MGNIKLSLIICSRNDEYMGNSRWRLETTINLSLHYAAEAKRLDQIEILVSDWGSDVPLKNVLSLTKEAEERVSFIHVPSEIAIPEQKDSKFPEVLALNAVARRANGDYIGRIDNDTIVGKGFFDRFFGLIENREQYDLDLENSYLFVERRMVPYRLTSQSFPCALIDSYLKENGDQLLVESGTHFGKPFWQSPVGIMLMHRNIWFKARGYDERLLYWGWMESDFVIRIKKENPIVDFRKYVGNFFYHLEHYHNLTNYKNRNGLATPRKKNETIANSESYAANDENWGLKLYSLNLESYKIEEVENWNNPHSIPPKLLKNYPFFLLKMKVMLKYDDLIIALPDIKEIAFAKTKIFLGKIKQFIIK